MVKVALFVTIEAKPGKETQVENFLRSALPLVQEEPNTINWYALKISPSTFGIFDTFHTTRHANHISLEKLQRN